MDSISNSENVKHQKRKLNIKGTMAGLATGTAALCATVPVSMLTLNRMVNISKGLSHDEVQLTKDAANSILNNVTNLSKKGVTIKNITESTSSFLDTVKMPSLLKEMLDPVYATAKGKNAFFARNNSVYINQDKLPLAVFHELGHAYNFNNSAFWKGMQNMRIPSMALASIISMIPLLTKEEIPEEGRELTKGQKFKNGLRKASPILAFASTIPMLAEEGMASIRGCKWAKEVAPSIFKKVAKVNVIAFTSYLAFGLASAIFAYTAKKVKDHFQTKKVQETNAKA